jgi:hypothetical protein
MRLLPPCHTRAQQLRRNRDRGGNWAGRRIDAALTIPKRFGRNGAICRSPQALIKVDGTFV